MNEIVAYDRITTLVRRGSKHSISVTCTNTHSSVSFVFFTFPSAPKEEEGAEVEENEKEEKKDEDDFYFVRRQKSDELTPILGATCVCQGERQRGGDKEGGTESSQCVVERPLLFEEPITGRLVYL